MGEAPVGRIFACVLTYNRRDILLSCLEAVLGQTARVDRVVVFDNGSTDGTQDFLRERGILENQVIDFVRVEQNLKPAGGFSAMLRHAYDGGCDWAWAMDDDVIPEPDALEELVRAYRAGFKRPSDLGFLVSRVQTPDGRPNNVPDVETFQDQQNPPCWAELLHHAMVRVRWSTMNSVLFPRSTFEKFGLPSPDFVYGGEDVDLTMRIVRERPGYIVGRSLATHLRAVSGTFHPLNEKNPARLPLYFYYYRSQTYLRRAHMSRRQLCVFIAGVLKNALRALYKSPFGMSMARQMIAGVCAGLVFRPRPATVSPVIPASHPQARLGLEPVAR
jgi:GT2 family glycosyltransferase